MPWYSGSAIALVVGIVVVWFLFIGLIRLFTRR